MAATAGATVFYVCGSLRFGLAYQRCILLSRRHLNWEPFRGHLESYHRLLAAQDKLLSCSVQCLFLSVYSAYKGTEKARSER